MLSIAAAAHDLSAAYPFRTTLFNAGDDQYELYWKFDLAVKNIQFAVRVNTTGWVGFGLSPNGGMPNSDVVIGWVDSSTGQGYLDVSSVYEVAIIYEAVSPRILNLCKGGAVIGTSRSGE